MKHIYVPVMHNGIKVGTAHIEADRLLISVNDGSIRKLLWDEQLRTSVSINIPGGNILTINPNNESEGNNNG